MFFLKLKKYLNFKNFLSLISNLKKMRKVVLLLLIIGFFKNINAQDALNKNICDQIFYFSNSITFPNQQNISTYKIAVFGKSSEVYNLLYNKYTGKTIHGKKISIKNITKTKELEEGFNILFVDKSKNKSISEIYQSIDGKSTLLITLDATDEKYFMINLKGDAKNYDINSFNMIDENFVVPEKILSVGGSKIDLQKLYKQKVAQLNVKVNQLNQKDKLLKDKEIELDKKDEEIKKEKKALDSLTNVVKKEKKDNKEKEIMLNQKDRDLKDKQQQIEKQAEEINVQKIKINFQYKVIAISVVSAMIFLFLSMVIFYQLRKNKRITKELRQKNEEIKVQKEQIEEQSKEIEVQRDIAIERGDELAHKNKEIQDSINTAVRIQRALLPETEFMSKVFSDYFINYKPRDIVSGDFYWAVQKHNKTIVVAADCTGHGVPGAMMSMLGISFLNQISETIEEPDTSKILVELSHLVIKSLKQDLTKEMRSKEGIDLSLIMFNPENMTINYAGANNSIYIVSVQKPEIIAGFEEFRVLSLENNVYQLFEIHADDRPIGVYNTEPHFITKTIKIQKGDCIFMFSDGFPDMYNFKKRQKFGSKRFKELLLNNAQKSLALQNKALEQQYADWHSENRQVDDILIIGIKI